MGLAAFKFVVAAVKFCSLIALDSELNLVGFFIFSIHVPLHQRIEYLSRAAMCAKSCTSHTTVPGEGEFLHELEEKMEVSERRSLA